METVIEQQLKTRSELGNTTMSMTREFRSGTSISVLVACAALAWTVVTSVVPVAVASAPKVGDVCHVKGQESNTIHGLGLVVGLKGTGDAELKPTARALAGLMNYMGNPVGMDASQNPLLDEIEDARNVALVFVSATIPGTGARQGDQLNCRVSAISAKSLEGGVLVMTPLLGPRPGSQKVYAIAQGPIELDDTDQPTSGRIHGGCRLEEDFFNQFSKDGKITLVLNKQHANFQMAEDVADAVNSTAYLQPQGPGNAIGAMNLAKPIDQVNIEVMIPEEYVDHPVGFISLILRAKLYRPEDNMPARVVINERAGTIVVSENVEIAPGVISHKNMIIDTGDMPDQFVKIDPGNTQTKLDSLIAALNAIKVPASDVIDIIKTLERSGLLIGTVIVE